MQSTNTTWKKAYRVAFPYTVPVLTGYLFIGIAFGVMFAQKGYDALWASFMSVTVYAGSGQYLATNFFVPDFSLWQVCFLTIMVNIRHMFYGLSLLEPFAQMGKKKWYMIFSLTDETYSLLCTTKVPPDIAKDKFLFAIASLDHLYWILGSVIGALAGTYIPFDATGIDFAMTALFIVILLEQWLSSKLNRIPILIGLGITVFMLLLFGQGNFILPSMLSIIALLVAGRGQLDPQMQNGCNTKEGNHV